jgi:hypothetical protein
VPLISHKRSYLLETQGIVRLFQTLPAATKSEYINLAFGERSLTFVEDREEALKDDFPLEGSAYDDEDEEDEWAGDDTAWNDEVDGRDESSAYLEFLNEEASTNIIDLNHHLTIFRHKSSRIWKTMIQMMS